MAKRIGIAALGGQLKFRHGESKIDFSPGAGHPIARNFSSIRWVDESYWSLAGDPARVKLLGTSVEDAKPRTAKSGRPSGVGAAFSSRFRGTLCGRSMIRHFGFSSSAELPGPGIGMSTASTN